MSVHLYLVRVPQVVLLCSQGWEPLLWEEEDNLDCGGCSSRGGEVLGTDGTWG